MENYYNLRADEYEEIYNRDDPIRQAEQNKIADTIRNIYEGRKVLEIACGTGYWTKYLSETASYICAVDNAPDMLTLAKSKKYDCPIDFMMADAFNPAVRERSFDGGLANFWFSHIPKRRIDDFMKAFHRNMAPGARIFMADNIFIPDLGGELIHPEGSEDTFKKRKLKNGSEHLVLKNYYSRQQLLDLFSRYNRSISEENIFYGDCFWFIFYEMN
ncbi:MAG: class I SAM-dependent methyltransferase [Candidatus Zixiibacteriota bacterium]